MVTREEQHSTRGRARLLFELLRGETIGHRGWRDEHVKKALDLCLACKGCKGDCPVNVDMATYKSEFLSHYYRGRLRPMPAYAMGLIHWWARLASLAPQFANFLTQTPPFSVALKVLGGIAPARTVPRFADETFKAWFRRRPVTNPEGRRVILWPDTFNNHFHPETAKAAVHFLETSGFRVIVPEAALCCGRPLYDWGMLHLAKHLLRRILQTLQAEIRAGTPLVGLEPSCVAVFRDELLNLFPHDEDAKRLAKQTYHLSEFLNREATHVRLPRLERKALLHGHCQHKAIMKLTDEEQLLRKLGLELELPDSGCCGMAGSFGFERDKYDVSVQCGERVLLPAVRNAPKDTLIIADGFSCREQIKQLTDRRALHLAQVLQMASEQAACGPDGDYPERRFFGNNGAGRNLPWRTLGLAALLLTAAIYERKTAARRMPIKH
jgi:Fe-S oxidoreductase